MHSPRPHGVSVIGAEPSAEDLALVESLTRKLTNLKAASSLESLRMVRSLPDGGYVVAQDAGGVFRAILHKPIQEASQAFDGLAKLSIPMLFSGVVTKAAVPAGGGGISIRLTEACRTRLAGYGDKKPPKDVTLQRFRCAYNPIVAELAPTYATSAFFSQYAGQRPTWYSGAMAEVMQIVGGYGRQDLENLPDSPVERATMRLPDDVAKAVAGQLGNARLPGYSGFPPKSGEFQYDYKFHHTHGVAFDTSGAPWLILVNPGGVWAMPLPIIPATVTPAFREYLDQVGDTELSMIVERFGGLPSGESFPVREKDFQAWRRAGVIIKICDTADFYSNSAYFSGCGWSFNTSGTEGYNTCYNYDETAGFAYGLGYKMKIDLVPADDRGWASTAKLPNNPDELRRFNGYLGKLYQVLNDTNPEHLAIKYKIRRSPASDVLKRAGGVYSMDSEVDYWNSLELDPISNHGGSVVNVSRGYLYSGAKFKYQPQIKFPEPYLGGCVSFDFSPLEVGRNSGKYPACDTIMFGYYAGDSLKVVRYFRDDAVYYQKVESDFTDCMIVGSWKSVRTEGSTAIHGKFYTSDFDDRAPLAPVVETTKVTGSDLGYDTTPWFAFDQPFWKPGTIWRNRYFTSETVTTRTEGHFLDIAICVPFYCRNALLHAFKQGTTGKGVISSGNMYSVRDPNTYRFWTYDDIMHWAGGLEVMAGRPIPKNASPVWVEIAKYSPSKCSDFADNGPWISGLPADYTWLIHPKSGQYLMSGGGGAPAYKGYTTGSHSDGDINGRVNASIGQSAYLVHSSVPNGGYFIGSPDDIEGMFYQDGCSVTFGETEYSSVSDSDYGKRKYWGYTSLADHSGSHQFIGVINE